MSFIQNFYTSRDNNTDGNTYVGQEGRLWYNPSTNSIYVNTANVVGGTPVALATGANIVANIITVNTITSTGGNVTVTGNLIISGNISPATDVKIGGVKAGPGANIANDGTLTIDTANLPLSFGNFTASNNVLSIVNVDEDMILQTQGSAEIQLVGNIGFYKPDGIPPNTANRFAFFNDDGQATFYVPTADPLEGAFKIIGSATGTQISPAVMGVMLHVTGQPNAFSSVYNDGINNFSNYIGRRYNGNTVSPTQVVAGNTIVRFSGQGYTSAGFSGASSGSLSLDALENFTSTNQGAIWRVLVNPVAGNTRQEVANISVANGVTATQFNTTGNITATGNIAGGNLILSTGGIISASGNITTSGTVVGNVSGLLTRRVRDAGTIADGGTLTIDFATDDLVKCVWNNGMTITGSNYTAGRVVKVMATKGAGSGTDSITFNGFTASQTSTGTTTQAYNADVTAIVEFISTTALVGGVYVKV